MEYLFLSSVPMLVLAVIAAVYIVLACCVVAIVLALPIALIARYRNRHDGRHYAPISTLLR